MDSVYPVPQARAYARLPGVLGNNPFEADLNRGMYRFLILASNYLAPYTDVTYVGRPSLN